jgi:hypothetical protein
VLVIRIRCCKELCAVVVGLASLDCGGDPEGTYDASLADIRDDVQLKLSVATDGSGELSLIRWYGSKAYGWEHCPRIHAAGSVNGRALELVESGGWVPASGSGLLSGSGGYCRDMRYRFGPGTLQDINGSDVAFRLEDESGTMELATPYIASELTLGLLAPTQDTLIPGQPSELALLPGVSALELSGCSISYRGQLAHKTLVQQYASFHIQPTALELTANGLAFVTPPTEDSHGTLKLDCQRGAGWAAGVARCVGVAGCKATRSDPAALELEISVSANGQPVTPDPTQDPVGFDRCWFSTDVSGGVSQRIWLDGSNGCSGGLKTETSTLSMSWGASSPMRAALRATGLTALELAKGFVGELEISINGDTWITPPGGCSVELTRVEQDNASDFGDTYVVQGTSTCPELAAPAPSNRLAALKVEAIDFRAGVLVPR